MMKIPIKQKKQRGFFEIGLGLAIMALFGGATAVIVELHQPDDASNNFPACSEFTEEQLLEYIDVGIHCD